MSRIYDFKSNSLSFKDIDTKQGIVSGYFASFNTIDAENDLILPNSFSKTINENFKRIKHLLDHNPTKAVGKIQVLKEDNIGLYYESKAGSHDLGRDFLKMAESGIITEHSIGYMIPRGKSTIKDGIKMISEIKLMEGSSLQGWGMNENTPLTGIKSIWNDSAKVEKRIKELEVFCKNTDATDEAIEILLLEIKQLSQLIIDLKATPAEITLVPEQTKAKGLDANLILTYLSI